VGVRDPFKIDGPTCISFSGGRTSAYMLRSVQAAHGGKLPDEAVVCFANTGKEDEATLEFVRDCAEAWGIDIQWVEYRDNAAGFALVGFESASRNGEPFAAMIARKQYLPNPVARFCSHELKNKPIAAFSNLGDEDTMVGVRFDEPRRIAKMRARGFHLPLIDSKQTKQHVREFWRHQKFDLKLPERDGLTALGNCDLCFLKDFDVLMSNVKEKPQRAVWWARQEDLRGATFHKSRPSYARMREFALTQRDFVGYDEEAIACFCGD
jgi:3'-phosphoadenosine 5'-phosphosulfate sulfotransferase (PAPS reductase)/FAD synthetase